VDEKVARTAARLAAKLDTAWHAVHVETPQLQRLPEARLRILASRTGHRISVSRRAIC
jgi:two-component system sensor histidine kinase KdpD